MIWTDKEIGSITIQDVDDIQGLVTDVRDDTIEEACKAVCCFLPPCAAMTVKYTAWRTAAYPSADSVWLPGAAEVVELWFSKITRWLASSPAEPLWKGNLSSMKY